MGGIPIDVNRSVWTSASLPKTCTATGNESGSLEMKCRLVRQMVCQCCLIAICLLTAPVLGGDRASNDSLLNNALSVWRAGDFAAAEKMLSDIIENGTDDPRPLYFRGILTEQSGKDGTADLQAAAKLEAETSTASLVNRSIERTQGPLRVRIERYRLAARNALKADPENERLKLVYRDALEARRQGKSEAAIQLLRDAATGGADPRYFYMLGVTLAETGQDEEAKEYFVKGLEHEQTPEQSQLVSEALSGVQGDIRRMIEEQTSIEVAGQKITRQTNVREIRRRSLMTQDQLLADASAVREMAAARAEAEDAARRKAVADKILAENKARDAAAERMKEKAVAAADKPADPATTEMPDEPAVAATEPMPADPDAPVNPFLTGGAGTGPAMAAKSSVTAGPIDMSYLPASTEYLMYVRPGDLLESGFAKPLTDMPQFQQAMTEMSAQTGFVPGDIDSVTMGMGNLIATMIPVIGQAMGGGQPDGAAISKQLMGGENSMIVVRTNKDLDIAALMTQGNATESTHDGKTYYVLPNPDSNAPVMALHAVDSKTFLLASEAGLKAAMTNGPGEATNEQFAFVSRSSHLVQAFSSPLLAGMSAGIPDPPPNSPPQVAQLVGAIKGRISGGAIVMDAGSDLALNIKLNLTEESAAGEANQALTGLVMMGKQMAPFALGQAPPPLQPSLGQAVNSLASTSADSQVTVSITIPGTLVQVLKDNPELLGPMAGGPMPSASIAGPAPTGDSLRRTSNNLKQIGLAMHNFHDTFNHLPSADGNGEAGAGKKSGLSWRVHILPYLEHAELYTQFHLDEAWDSPHNMALVDQMPDVFKVDGVDEPGQTTVHVFASANTPFDPEKPIGFRDITDGTSNTILAVVAGPETAAPWTKPGGLALDTANPIGALGTIGEVFQAVFCDGAVQNVSASIPPQFLSNRIQFNDGNPL
jgi:tetratricopeptide (TPR) repeat protein